MNLTTQRPCIDIQSTKRSVTSSNSNQLLGGQVYKHIYGNLYRQGTAFQSWQFMLSIMSKLKSCQCYTSQRNTCRYTGFYEGYDLINYQQKKRMFSSTLFVFDCNNYNTTSRTYNCFLLTSYPERVSSPTWDVIDNLQDKMIEAKENSQKINIEKSYLLIQNQKINQEKNIYKILFWVVVVLMVLTNLYWICKDKIVHIFKMSSRPKFQDQNQNYIQNQIGQKRKIQMVMIDPNDTAGV